MALRAVSLGDDRRKDFSGAARRVPLPWCCVACLVIGCAVEVFTCRGVSALGVFGVRVRVCVVLPWCCVWCVPGFRCGSMCCVVLVSLCDGVLVFSVLKHSMSSTLEELI
ncbi:unnamed protein product [Discosporangium mesarthrocarpum]